MTVPEQTTDDSGAPPWAKLPYPLVCTVIGLALGWIPAWLHGPVVEKFDQLYIHGTIAVWAYYTARLLIGFWVGVTRWPPQWYLRGPLCGVLSMFPLTLVSLAMPECGWPCLLVNLTSGALLGLLVAGTAYAITGRGNW